MKRLLACILACLLLIPVFALAESYEQFKKLKAEEETPTLAPKEEPKIIPKDVIIRDLTRAVAPGRAAAVVFSSELILFDYGSSRLRESSYRQLIEIAAALRASALAYIPHFFVDGHTCSIGSDANNCRLSWRRANSVVRYLVEYGGVPPSKLIPRGFGECCPVAPNDNEYSRRLNRRVVLKSGLTVVARDLADKCSGDYR